MISRIQVISFSKYMKAIILTENLFILNWGKIIKVWFDQTNLVKHYSYDSLAFQQKPYSPS